MSKTAPHQDIIAQNRKARHEYTILETFEAGIILVGSEVKSLRLRRCSIQESYAAEENGTIVLINSDIPEYTQAGRFNHPPKRIRQLLLHKKQIAKLTGAVNKKQLTLVPLAIYFNARGLVKITLGLAQGRQKHDKRAAIKERDWQRQKQRVARGHE